jgi:thiol-disulfide isomerase/thioredoxin
MKFTKCLFAALSLALCLSAAAQDRPKLKKQGEAPAATPAPQAAAAGDEDAELRRAIEGSRGSTQHLVENLEGHLKKFPQSPRREEIEREIYKLALDLRDRNRVIRYGEKFVAGNERDLEVLTMLVSMLRERKGEGDLQKAAAYADKLIAAVEGIFVNNRKPARLSAAQWEDRKTRAFASVYFLRGQVRADAGQDSPAESDLSKSYHLAPLAPTALALAELAERRKQAEQAIEYYLRAFVLSFDSSEGVSRGEIRRKLGKAYAAKQGSEAGLGERLLKTYDALAAEREQRLARVTQPNINADVEDPAQFKLTRFDGSHLKLADYAGKVVVVNFWATWCGPCREELPLLEKAMDKYKDDADVVFLAVNADEDRELVEPYIKANKIKLPVVYANYLDEHFGVASIPTTMIFDRRGGITYRQAGFNRHEDFVGMISEKIEAAKKAAASASAAK